MQDYIKILNKDEKMHALENALKGMYVALKKYFDQCNDGELKK